MQPLLKTFHLLALLGLVLSVIAHLGALAGVSWPDEVMGLHIGIFVVFIPTILVMQRVGSNVPQRDLWKAAWKHCPDWVPKGLYGVFGYAMLNFIVFIVAPDKEDPVARVRGFSGHWMVFYAVSAATLYSAAEGWGKDLARRCPQGHPVSPTARFCDTCGAPIQAA